MWSSVALGVGMWGALYGAAMLSGHSLPLLSGQLLLGAAIYSLYMKFAYPYIASLGVPYVQYIFGAFLLLWVVGESLVSLDLLTMLAGAGAVYVGTWVGALIHKYVYYQ